MQVTNAYAPYEDAGFGVWPKYSISNAIPNERGDILVGLKRKFDHPLAQQVSVLIQTKRHRMTFILSSDQRFGTYEDEDFAWIRRRRDLIG